MKRAWLPETILRAASLLAPGDQRANWRDEWRSELWYVPPREALRFCLGAFRDALCLRQIARKPAVPLESPLSCVAFLAAVAALSLGLVVCLSGLLKMKPMYVHLGALDLPKGCVLTLVFTCLFLPATMSIGREQVSRPRGPWLRGVLFLVFKILLVQPILLCAFLLGILLAPVAFFAPIGMCATCILTLRWVLKDQQRRCPVCLRLLTRPVRIGTPSRTFLEWYGAESTCARGHGLLHATEIAASYSARPQWHKLDESWSGLFP